MNLITVSGVKGYIDEGGVAWLNTEAVARGLGLVQMKDEKEYVRWDRVNGYLRDMRFPHLVGKEFIPENVFYRLSMKGETYGAQAFQILVADEILPSIRKTGTYSVKPQSIEDLIILQAQSMKDLRLTQQQQAAVITDHEFKLADIDQKVTNEITLTTREQKQVQSFVNRRAFDMGLPDAYRQIYGALKKHFVIPSYRDLKRSDLTKAFEFIRCWSPRIS